MMRRVDPNAEERNLLVDGDLLVYILVMLGSTGNGRLRDALDAMLARKE